MIPGPDFDYLPFADGPYRMTMGLMALKPADWIEIDSRYGQEIALRKSLLEERRPEVLAALPGSEAACREVLDQLAGFLPERFPDLFERAGSELANRVSGDRWSMDGDVPDPLDIAGRLVQEDLCILQEVEGELRLTAGVLCFPNRWRLSDKLGRPMMAIHEPVPSYAERLGKPVDRFIGMLAPERPVWRLNWSLTDDPALFQPVGHGRWDTDPDITRENAGSRIFLRVERQTLRRLPRTGAVLFTIRTHQSPLESLTDRPRELARLAESVRGLPEDTARYKSIMPFRESLLAYLDGATSPFPTSPSRGDLFSG
jgi:dimethylamine monooxygenase subunit A